MGGGMRTYLAPGAQVCEAGVFVAALRLSRRDAGARHHGRSVQVVRRACLSVVDSLKVRLKVRLAGGASGASNVRPPLVER